MLSMLVEVSLHHLAQIEPLLHYLDAIFLETGAGVEVYPPSPKEYGPEANPVTGASVLTFHREPASQNGERQVSCPSTSTPTSRKAS